MKKYISLLLVFSLLLCGLCACGKAAPVEEPEEPEEPEVIDEPETIDEPEVIDEPLVGGYTVNTETAPGEIPENAKAAFDLALENMVGASFEPVAYLGSQVVAGLNHKYLCRVAAVVPNAPVSYSVVTVYAALDGTAMIKEVKELDLPDYVSVESDVTAEELTEKGLAGGWTLSEDFGTTLPENAQAAFDAATAGLLGAFYRPIACLGTQVVAGTNYAILAAMSTVTAEPKEGLVVLTIYAALDGTAEISHIAAV